jgi:hypothetical protein
MAAIRASSCSSNRKFWPNALDAARPCVRTVSRSGGSVSAHCVGLGGAGLVVAGAAIGGAGSHADGRDHRAGFGQATAGNVERRAMIGRGAHDRQAQRRVHAIIKIAAF